MSLVRQAVRGAAWTTVTSMAARLFSLAATLLLTHKIAPGEYGQAQAATVVVLSANILSTPWLANYVIVDRTKNAAVAWYANWFHQAFGLVVLAASIPLGPWLGGLLHAPELVRYLPLAAVAVLIERLGIVPEKIIVRELKFKHLALTRMASEMTYGVVTLGTAYLGWGGMSLIVGMLARSIVKTGMFAMSIPWRSWMQPQPIDAEDKRKMIDYAWPLWISGLFGYMGGNWDNLIVSHYFGPAVMATYGLAFTLAEMPAAQIGEQLCEVMLPSFVLLGDEQRRRALIKSTLVVALVTFPVAAGLAAISKTMVEALFDARWAAMAPMLALLCIRSLTRTINYPIIQYLQAVGRTGYQMLLSIVHTTTLLTLLVFLGGRSAIVTCLGVVGCHIALAMFSIALIKKEGVEVTPIIVGTLRITAACAAMAGAVLGVRSLLAPFGLPPLALLFIEIAAGAIAYVPAALVLARGTSRDLLSWLKRGLGRGNATAE